MKAFKQITDLALSADWTEEDRRIIFYSFLRQAQGEEDLEKRKALLLSASGFILFDNEGLKDSDKGLFPPPLMEELRLMKKQANFLSLDWEKIFPDHEILLINGRQIQKDIEVKIPQAFYRVSAFSSSHRPWSKNLSLSDLLLQDARTKSLTKGSCRNLQVQLERKEKNLELLAPSSCPDLPSLGFEEPKVLEKKRNERRDFSKSRLFVENGGQSRLKNLESSLSSLNSELLNSDDFLAPLEDLPSEKRSRLEPWLLAGAGLAVFVLVISLNQKKKPQQGEYIY